MAHARGVSVEGELGCLGSLEHGSGEQEDGHGAEGVLTHDQLLPIRKKPRVSCRDDWTLWQ